MGMRPDVVATKVRIPHAPSMPVERLDSLLDSVWSHRLGLIVAPAGSGKTTLLARFAARAPGPVGWYRAESWDRREETLLSHIEAALAPVMEGVPEGWDSVAMAANAMASWRGERILLVIDDLHTLEGTPAEAAVERLIEYAPPLLTILAASRVPPQFNLSRLRVSGALLEVGGDDLRFRSWEVERLFHDFYEEPLPPEELARLARRTEGWAAGLQLFHLATRGRTPDERRRVLAELGPSSRLMRDYLTRNVLDQLPTELRRFLVDTSVLGRLSAAVCDNLLARTGSADVLQDLERRRLFTQALADDGVYRYHEVLRSHLQGVLLEELGEDGLRQRFRAAAHLLAEAGALAEALEAFCRGDDWDQARRLLGSNGEAVAEGPSPWIDALPPALVMHDQWLLLASARRLRAEGRFRQAIDRYQLAEAAFGTTDAAAICRSERHALLNWLEPERSRKRDASALLRNALTREPMAVAREAAGLAGVQAELVGGLAALVAGNVAQARRELVHAAERPDAGTQVQSIAALAAGVAGLLMGQRHATVEVEGAVAAAEALGLDWVARLGRASLALTGSREALREAEGLALTNSAAGDPWTEALCRLFATWGSLIADRGAPRTDGLVVQLRALGAPVLESWARGMAALAEVRAGEPDARDAALAAEAGARSTGVPAARLLAYLALAEASPENGEGDEYRDMVGALAQEMGLLPPIARHETDPAAWSALTFQPVTNGNGHAGGDGDRPTRDAGSPPANGKPAVPPLSIRLLGGFDLRLAGGRVDLSAVRPRARILLRLLSLHAGDPVHHETIEAALWPDADPDGSSRNLHVAIAALRRALEPDSSRGAFRMLRREGDAYRLVVPVGGEVDLRQFEAAILRGDVARDRAEAEVAVRSYQEALELYRGEVLPEDGPAEWVSERRELTRLAAVEAAQALGEILLERHDARGAARACTVGLRIERYHDPLWRLLIQARDRAGDQGAATRARLGYDTMLAELGVAQPPATPA